MPPADDLVRGACQFQVTGEGSLLNSATNVERLRALWLERTLIAGEEIGPGDPGDFDVGAWHVACHLAGAGGACRSAQGDVLWLEISHDRASDLYYASVSAKTSTVRLDSAEGRALVQGAKLLGFVEGNSTGRTSARDRNDPPTLFNLWRRQDFDQPPDSTKDGGKVWEHWCTQRDIRMTASIGTSVLTAYVSLVAALGDRFIAAVARGRRDYGHPRQLSALVRAGFVAEAAALWDTTPVALPATAERLFLEAQPAKALAAAAGLDWANPPRYYMFARRIASWSPAADVRRDLQTLDKAFPISPGWPGGA